MTLTIPAEGPSTSAVVRPTVRVLADRCAGCQECVVRCPTEALTIDPVTWTAVADDTRCVGCRQCERTCPFAAIVVDGPQLVAPRVQLHSLHPAHLRYDRTETRRAITSWSEALSEASRCLDCPDPTCVRGCPAHNDIPGFIRAVGAGDLDEAHRVLRRTSVLPDVCSRVCDQALQCEGACSWSLAGAPPVAIGALERFVTDNAPVPAIETPDPASPDAVDPLEVAVVGSGPAAVGATAELVARGAKVTVLERDQEPGGLLAWGIPDFTLPEAVKRRPWEQLTAAGVELHTNHAVDPAELAELAERYDAVVVAAGASVPIRLPVDGADLDGVWTATEFLQAAHRAIAERSSLAALAPRPLGSSENGTTRPARVLVLGAGNTAMDVGRCARRLGAEALCVDWMDRRFAPVRPDELEEARDEGVEVRFSTTVLVLEGRDGHVASAVLAATRQRSAAERPQLRGAETSIEPVDLVVMAMGYRIDPPLADAGHGVPVRKAPPSLVDRRFLASGLLANPAPEHARRQPVGQLALGRDHGLTLAALCRTERTWFVGDALVGPSTVVEAMAQGRVAAQAICHHRPRRPARRPAEVRHVVVATESRAGTTRSLGDAVAAALGQAGLAVRHLPLADVGPDQLAWADALVVGTWVDGMVVAGVGPARATRRWLDQLPPVPGLPVALFCSYGVAPKETLTAMRRAVEARGAAVVAEVAFRRRGRPNELDAFARRLTDAYLPSAR
jgi:glutamate synthase (NADPH/NADH) small chain